MFLLIMDLDTPKVWYRGLVIYGVRKGEIGSTVHYQVIDTSWNGYLEYYGWLLHFPFRKHFLLCT